MTVCLTTSCLADNNKHVNDTAGYDQCCADGKLCLTSILLEDIDKCVNSTNDYDHYSADATCMYYEHMS